MRKLIKSINVRSADGRIQPAPDTFTTGFVRETSAGYLPISDSAVVDTALRILAERVTQGPLMSSPGVVKDFLRLRFSGLQHEVFCVLYLDRRHRLIACEDLFRGTVDGASVFPREIIKASLRHNATSILCAHNHPSNNPSPSQADELITTRIKAAVELLDLRLLDHVIVTARETVSLAELGLL
jgi:DNA repair protein RadC